MQADLVSEIMPAVFCGSLRKLQVKLESVFIGVIYTHIVVGHEQAISFFFN